MQAPNQEARTDPEVTWVKRQATTDHFYILGKETLVSQATLELLELDKDLDLESTLGVWTWNQIKKITRDLKVGSRRKSWVAVWIKLRFQSLRILGRSRDRTEDQRRGSTIRTLNLFERTQRIFHHSRSQKSSSRNSDISAHLVWILTKELSETTTRIEWASFSMHSRGNILRNLTVFRFESLVKKGVNECSMFAIYDGHGGSENCNFLKENLHTYIFSGYN